jgi:hypothetical protein
MPIKPCLRVACPKCGAKAGNQCVLVGKFAGQSSTMCHDERVASAKAISKEDASQAVPGSSEKLRSRRAACLYSSEVDRSKFFFVKTYGLLEGF